ncbi:MAG TPA: hypothetical protein VEL70_06210 [Candidatus Acidoferrum sp.]|nr:hypothetical protein [Candidatus Acidoferrum sp.]
MACNNRVKITKKKIAVLSSAASGIAATTYVAFTLTHNPAIAATIPALLSLAACPAMCVGMGGAFWLVRRFSGKNRNKDQMQESKEEENEESSCCSSDDKQQELRTNSIIPKRKNKDDVETPSYYLQNTKSNSKINPSS